MMDNSYTLVDVNGYRGEVTPKGEIAGYMTGKGSMPDAAELRRYAAFLLELAETAERLTNLCDECGERIPDDDAVWHYHPGVVMGAGGHDDMPDDREAYYNERAERMP
jgi:hypothetical protein